jgi:tRNA threonylcarbamoyladenosine biosynthesis protein TsaB
VKVVALETSGPQGSVALLDESTVLSEGRLPPDQRTARSVLPCLQDMLNFQRWRPADVDLVCTTTGPGSFTGLRIGVVTAKTFAYATGAKLVGVHTLAAMAAGVGEVAHRLWTVLDAQRGELFVALFDNKRPLIDAAPPPTEILPARDWLDRLKPHDVVAGPPLAKWRDKLPSGVIVADEAAWTPMAGPTGRLGVDLFPRHGGIDPLALVPQYFRKSAAEEKAHLAPGQ